MLDLVLVFIKPSEDRRCVVRVLCEDDGDSAFNELVRVAFHVLEETLHAHALLIVCQPFDDALIRMIEELKPLHLFEEFERGVDEGVSELGPASHGERVYIVPFVALNLCVDLLEQISAV